jgi:hypothetical protein
MDGLFWDLLWRSFKDATTADISREYQNLFAAYAYFWELQALLPVKCCMYTHLNNSKQVGKLHLDRSSGKLFPNANYGYTILLNAISLTKKICVHPSRTLMTP